MRGEKGESQPAALAKGAGESKELSFSAYSEYWNSIYCWPQELKKAALSSCWSGTLRSHFHYLGVTDAFGHARKWAGWREWPSCSPWRLALGGPVSYGRKIWYSHALESHAKNLFLVLVVGRYSLITAAMVPGLLITFTLTRGCAGKSALKRRLCFVAIADFCCFFLVYQCDITEYRVGKRYTLLLLENWEKAVPMQPSTAPCLIHSHRRHQRLLQPSATAIWDFKT